MTQAPPPTPESTPKPSPATPAPGEMDELTEHWTNMVNLALQPLEWPYLLTYLLFAEEAGLTARTVFESARTSVMRFHPAPPTWEEILPRYEDWVRQVNAPTPTPPVLEQAPA